MILRERDLVFVEANRMITKISGFTRDEIGIAMKRFRKFFFTCAHQFFCLFIESNVVTHTVHSDRITVLGDRKAGNTHPLNITQRCFRPKSEIIRLASTQKVNARVCHYSSVVPPKDLGKVFGLKVEAFVETEDVIHLVGPEDRVVFNPVFKTSDFRNALGLIEDKFTLAQVLQIGI